MPDTPNNNHEVLPFDDILKRQEANPDRCIGPDGLLIDERLLPRGKSRIRNSKHKKEILAAGGDELDAAVKRENKKNKNEADAVAHLNWLNDDKIRNEFVQLLDLGASNDEILRSFPSLNGSSLLLSICRKRCGVSRDRRNNAIKLRSVREKDQLKKDLANDKSGGGSENSTAITRLSNGTLVYADGTNASSGKLEAVQSKKKLSFIAAFRDCVTYEQACKFWSVLLKKAIIDEEPWAIKELGDRMYGRVDQGILNHAVQSEIVDQMDMSQLDATELRALANVAARLAGTSQSDINQPDFIEKEPTPLPRTSDH